MTGNLRFAKLRMEEKSAAAIDRVSPGQVTLHSMGPLVADLAGGLIANHGLVTACADVEGSISMTPCRLDEADVVVCQLDIAHSCQNLRTAASFCMSIDDAASMLTRLQTAVDLAKLEAGPR